MNIRLYNARILTMEPGREVFYGEVWVKTTRSPMWRNRKNLRRNGTNPSSPELRGISNWIARETF